MDDTARSDCDHDHREQRVRSTTVGLVTDNGRANEQRVLRRLASLMAFEVLTLAIASILHLAGVVDGRSAPFDGEHAGIAEAVIGIVLAGAALGMVRVPSWARTIALTATGFATLGFLVGLQFTVRGGHRPDVAYHLVMLPVFIGTLVVLLRRRSWQATTGVRM
jgi:hypothetical protein